jgi:hypothetical protein
MLNARSAKSLMLSSQEHKQETMVLMGTLHCERGEKDEKTTNNLGFECTVLTNAPSG